MNLEEPGPTIAASTTLLVPRAERGGSQGGREFMQGGPFFSGEGIEAVDGLGLDRRPRALAQLARRCKPHERLSRLGIVAYRRASEHGQELAAPMRAPIGPLPASEPITALVVRRQRHRLRQRTPAVGLPSAFATKCR